jgi:hypothetical protein
MAGDNLLGQHSGKHRREIVGLDVDFGAGEVFGRGSPERAAANEFANQGGGRDVVGRGGVDDFEKS